MSPIRRLRLQKKRIGQCLRDLSESLRKCVVSGGSQREAMPRRRRARRVARRPANVFLNIPYDDRFKRFYLAYISGISAFGLVPRATLEIATSTRRLDRILKLISKCRVSLHDMSRVEIDRTPPCTPRFNMPFELGLSVAHARDRNGTRGSY